MSRTASTVSTRVSLGLGQPCPSYVQGLVWCGRVTAATSSKQHESLL